ncbi:MAG: hypothetical protein EXX96DRAFT_229091 [Benjaminiella poitrasii]|nr:MAG: hypothetical protein EXX96DRAFT_229091 [Benjaminiella poitrasii]
MSRSPSQFPKKIDTRNSDNYLKSYLTLQGHNERETLPTMEEIVDICTGRPRLLRVRRSPLEILHDPAIPPLAVHNWYLYNALDYLENSLFVLFEDWETDYNKRMKKQVPGHLFSQYVHNIYQCYKEIGLLFQIPIPFSSALAAPELKQAVQRASLSLIHSMIPSNFLDTRTQYFRSQLVQFLETPCLFHPHYRSRQPAKQVQKVLDDKLLELENVRCVSDEVLRRALQDDEDESMEDEEEGKEGKDMKEFEMICQELNQLQLTEDWTEMVKEVIEKELESSDIIDDWTESIVQEKLRWLHVFVLPWISYVTSREDTDANWYDFLREKIKVEHLLYELIYRIRIKDIFDIIREYPTTSPAIVDFHIISTKRGLLNDLKTFLMDEIRYRLLHLGASLQDILTQYEACVTCLSVIDPSCEILEPVIKLIKHYLLRQRNYRRDVLLGIVNQVRERLDEDPIDSSKLYVFKKLLINDEEVPHALDDFDRDKPARLNRLRTKVKDPIAMLISLCKSLKDFIDGYGNALGQALMTAQYATDTEVRRIELLKRHFPPDSFLRCDIMLKDVEDSRRLDRQLHESKQFEFPLHSTMMTRQYWIASSDSEEEDEDEEEEEVQWGVYEGLEDTMEMYGNEYKQLKMSRRLKFKPMKGMVTLDLEFENRTMRVEASPEAALVIAVFETRDQLFTCEQVASKVGMKRSQVIKCLQFWREKEILELTARGEYHLLED